MILGWSEVRCSCARRCGSNDQMKILKRIGSYKFCSWTHISAIFIQDWLYVLLVIPKVNVIFSDFEIRLGRVWCKVASIITRHVQRPYNSLQILRGILLDRLQTSISMIG